jgi:hypothetical protein
MAMPEPQKSTENHVYDHFHSQNALAISNKAGAS